MGKPREPLSYLWNQGNMAPPSSRDQMEGFCTNHRAFYEGKEPARFQMGKTKKYWNMSAEVRPFLKDVLSLNLESTVSWVIFSSLKCLSWLLLHKKNHFYLESQDVRLPLTRWLVAGAALEPSGSEIVFGSISLHWIRNSSGVSRGKPLTYLVCHCLVQIIVFGT